MHNKTELTVLLVKTRTKKGGVGQCEQIEEHEPEEFACRRVVRTYSNI